MAESSPCLAVIQRCKVYIDLSSPSLLGQDKVVKRKKLPCRPIHLSHRDPFFLLLQNPPSERDIYNRTGSDAARAACTVYPRSVVAIGAQCKNSIVFFLKVANTRRHGSSLGGRAKNNPQRSEMLERKTLWCESFCFREITRQQITHNSQ
jgi:hypothetical protein